MTIKSICEHERKSIQRFNRYQLPYYMKRYGLILTALCFVGLLVNRFTLDSEIFRVSAKYVMVLGLLVASISKEKIEDERVKGIRMTSYAYGFIFTVLWVLINPFLIYTIEYIIGEEPIVLQQNGDVVILWMLLSIQIAFFHLFKKVL